MRGLFYTPQGAPKYVAPGLFVLALVTGLTLLVLHLVGRPKSEAERARALLETGRAAEAEVIDARIVLEDPTVPHVLDLVSAHRRARAARIMFDAKLERFQGQTEPAAPMSEAALEAVVASLPHEVALMGRFAAFGSEDARGAITVEANREPPMPWANHVLAVAARNGGDDLGAAALYWREGTTFPERRDDIDEALRCWIDAGAWELVADKMEEPAARGVSPHVRYEIALHDRDWRKAVGVLPAMYRARFDGRFVWLAAVAALAWAFFCARLGKVGDRPKVRAPLYLAAFVLGVLSVVPTFVLITIEEAKLHLVASGEMARDLVFFVFGVGLREEASKLLMFALLLPVLRRWGDKLDVVVCGAMVGLGFAAEENLGYLADENLHTGLARFLTANFLHVAMTGILASALDDFIRNPEKHASAFTRATLLVVGLHGAYDFLIAHHELGGAYAAMAVFVLLTKIFLDTVEAARRRADRTVTPMHAFVLALAIVTGASFAHAIDTVGLQQGSLVMLEGLLGEGVMLIVFARVLATL